MKNTVRVKQLIDFVEASRQWLQANPNNQNSPLAHCINKVTPGIIEAIKPVDEASQNYNAEVTKLKARHADTVKITENSQTPQHAITEYSYSGSNLEQRQIEIQAAWDKFVPQRDGMFASEVEVEVAYVDKLPTPQILPPAFITVFRGIVIDPEHDDNKVKILSPKG